MKIRLFLKTALVVTLMTLTIYSCKQISEISKNLASLQNLKFKLENITNFKLIGIDLASKNSISNFSVTDGLKLTQAFTSKSFPADFVLNIAASNPNDGTKGTRSTLATITSLDWQLYIDDVQTVSGILNDKFDVPASGQKTIIPLRINVDLYKFFQNKSYEGIVNLALALGGVNGSAARVKLDARPTVNTPFGPISSPRITIIDKEFR